MVLPASEFKLKSITTFWGIFRSAGLSLRWLKRITVGLMVGIILAFLVLWQPAYAEFQSIQKQKDDWLFTMTAEGTNLKSNHKLYAIPSMDQLPDMIEKCCDTFVKEGIDVVSFNVERFGERNETENKMARLDYALVRLRLQGQWNDIVASLKGIEEVQELSIHVQEVILASEGGDVLLQIYFYSGETR